MKQVRVALSTKILTKGGEARREEDENGLDIAGCYILRIKMG
jgi:hypothetical protein